MGAARKDDQPGLTLDLKAFQRDGALRLPALFDSARVEALRELPTSGPGVRLHDARLHDLITPATEAATALMRAQARPVRAVVFDKTADANWLVAWHQDRTICVAERVEAEGFGPWSRKNGALHVAPPVSILERMVTLRIHLDHVGPDNAPLRAALGSHCIGVVSAADAAARAATFAQVVCLAAAGDVWAYATPILHASDRSRTPIRRRVLQVDYASADLPGGLTWAGVG
ncbi:phytanoyl-CoA dioxygenase family protein [Phenylobacterium sp.]|uniref:phytanoyl-CoA dioxygenase family protein n=1 Tax=Phenylobacterium sp. TaxID=1871053 RepID=UPI003D2B69EF